MSASSDLPILYSFRRCPYAIRARMAIAYTGERVMLREVSLANKPEHMLSVSPKGTVPVLILADGSVLEQSLDIMYWALSRHDPDHWSCTDNQQMIQEMSALIEQNDVAFKRTLDLYKYTPEQSAAQKIVYRTQGESFLSALDLSLQKTRFLLGMRITLADIAIFPFVRQFAYVDIEWFEKAGYEALKNWLFEALHSELFLRVMERHKSYQPDDEPVIFC